MLIVAPATGRPTAKRCVRCSSRGPNAPTTMPSSANATTDVRDSVTRSRTNIARMESLRFPDSFLIGASISAHQTEGNNTNTDWWWWEHIASTPCREPSGDACDFYHRYREDIAMLAGFGLNSFRFGIEWARIEPAEGEFSRAQLAHYRRILDTCHEHG